MNWRCLSCGQQAKTKRQRCRKCGGALWRPEAEKDLSGPMKQIALRGLLLANLGKQAPTPDSGGIECGKCHAVIYRADSGFDVTAFQEARKKHYSVSSGCEEKD